ncbi:substrate-binding domain-containing protein [Endozoicomonas sp. SM1973]|uniref:Substrate-binding domain-containing protein n=1 Tax=Spartinivicinus marinus TaxID=2994442 RepID=A0A853I880_9GAMM|nr:extracellular solute-binding protein [Spartinivicinus marinus]MCX4026486.1 substrate-binding domain-containing protein [Spartinivicinus marinus]NYZ66858.1 substrate-binding domain-containing protein [Spartinivicinus marinus]
MFSGKKLTLGLSIVLSSTLANGASLHNSKIEHQPKDGVVTVFGPGGPHTALIRAGNAFQAKTGNKVEVVFGPEYKWTERAQKSADIIFGSSEQSMTAFTENYKFFDEKNVEPIYIRPAVIIVKKGNPKKISGFQDLLKPGVKVVVTEGKGVYNTSGTGVWEDVAGRLGKLDDVKKLRSNIISYEKGSGASFRAFKEKQADAWITWAHWALNHTDKTDYVEIEPERRIYRDMNIAISTKADKEATEFAEFLKSKEALKIFKSEGWIK